MVRHTTLRALPLCLAARALLLVGPLPGASSEDITPRVGIIEIYGAHKVPVKKIAKELGFAEGDTLKQSPYEIEDRLDKISGVVASRIEATCCENGRMILYVGIEERDTPHFAFRSEPAVNTALSGFSADFLNTYRTFLDCVSGTLTAKHADEGLTNGYSLMASQECRDHQETFLEFAAHHQGELDQVLRTSADSEQRAMAAYLMQYVPRDSRSIKTMLDDLQYALLDPDDDVRGSAMQSLKAVAVGAKLHPEQEIKIRPTWFVELINSVAWSDRRDASLALVNLTDSRDPETLALLRERALQSIVEMARWHDLKHALPGFILAGRLGGLSEKQIQDAWVSGDREAVIARAIHPNSKKAFSVRQAPS